MVQVPVNRVIDIKQPLPTGTPNRASYVVLHGVRNSTYPGELPESPLSLRKSVTVGCVALGHSVAGSSYDKFVSLDAANCRPAYYAQTWGWDSRLYASAYTKFSAAARQGSAEWGMNIVQGRQTLRTFIQLALTAGTTVAVFCQANRVGLAYLKRHRETTLSSAERKRRKLGRDLVMSRLASERRRISNEIWILDQVTSTLLAYRYGVAPLMSDLYATAEILSGEFKQQVGLRKSASVAWSRGDAAWEDRWTGTERVTLRATVSVSNPNLLLANRLGITNPQLWLWDATPWSFIVDWWFPIGSFLQNFTALVGLTLTGCSVTRTREWSGTWDPPRYPNGSFKGYTTYGGMRFYGKRKERVSGTLPIPSSVPYGSGLGIQRGQNALALIVQKLK